MREQTPHTLLTLSVIIPTLNAPLLEEVVRRILDELSTLDANTYSSEVIVVGRDDTSFIENLDGVRSIDTKVPVGASTSRNIGIRAAIGEWLLFIDSDCLVQPGWAIAITEQLAGGKPVVGGGVTFPTNDYWQLVYNLSMFHEFLTTRDARRMSYLPTLNLAVNRNVIESVGYMDEELVRGQDMDWTIRMLQSDFQLFFEPTAAVIHQPTRSDLRTVWRYWILSGYYNSRNRQKYREHYGTPKILSYPWLMRILSPAIALVVTAKIYVKSPEYLRFITTVPGVYLTKIAWCLGASLREEPIR